MSVINFDLVGQFGTDRFYIGLRALAAHAYADINATSYQQTSTHLKAIRLVANLAWDIEDPSIAETMMADAFRQYKEWGD